MQWCAETIRDRWGIRGECLSDVSLAPLTTWKVGGSADLLVRPLDLEDVHALFVFLRHYRLPWLILGGGSNVLIADNGVRGVVIQLSDMNYIIPCGECQLRVGAGCKLRHLVLETARLGYAGIESLAGIPGSVGGAVVGNAGASGQQIGDSVVSALVAELTAVERWSTAEFDFSYRHSAVQPYHALLEIVLNFSRGEVAKLQEEVKSAGVYRRKAQAVTGANAGSVFKNPRGQQAWKLIAASGVQGAEVGGAQVSMQHANFIVNNGSASAADIITLIAKVQHQVAQHTGYHLQPEVKMLGDFAEMTEQVALITNDSWSGRSLNK
ncbi:MAG: UDP-N-acetylmuramate dehydrogenase [Desulfuromonas sp.]|nr:UDP-N-acetylmuramate dehydrogenase [Desulfuromonas sp.]